MTSMDGSSEVAAAAFAKLQQEHASLQGQYDRLSAQGNQLLQQLRVSEQEKASLLQRKVDMNLVGKLVAHGTKFDGRTGSKVDDWISWLEKNFTFYQIPDAQKVQVADMLLVGSADQWWKSMKANGSDTQQWGDFTRMLKEMFQPISSEDKARRALDDCRQGNRSVQAYTDEFRRWKGYLPNMHEGDTVHRYVSNLTSSVRREVLKKGVKTLEQAIQTAITAEAYADPYNTKAISRAFAFGGQGHRSYHSHSHSQPMDISNINSESSSNSNLTDSRAWPEEIDREKYDSGEDWDSASNQDPEDNLSLEPSLSAVMGQMQNKLEDNARQMQHLLAMFQRRKGKPASGGRTSGSTSQRVANVSKEDFVRCRKEGRCLNCKQKGHMARDCKNPFSLKF